MDIDLENAIRRGDENFDQLEREREESQKEIERLEKLVDYYSGILDEKCDLLRERDKELLAMRRLCDKYKLNHYELEEYGYDPNEGEDEGEYDDDN